MNSGATENFVLNDFLGFDMSHLIPVPLGFDPLHQHFRGEEGGETKRRRDERRRGEMLWDVTKYIYSHYTLLKYIFHAGAEREDQSPSLGDQGRRWGPCSKRPAGEFINDILPGSRLRPSI